jgi:hypothetical protein
LKHKQRNLNEHVAEVAPKGKRSYQLRQYQEQEAKEEIEDFIRDEENPQRIISLGKKRHE